MEEKIHIDETNINERTKRALKRLGIFYLDDVNKEVFEKLKEYENIKEKYIEELKSEIYMYGMELFENDEEFNECQKWRNQNKYDIKQSEEPIRQYIDGNKKSEETKENQTNTEERY